MVRIEINQTPYRSGTWRRWLWKSYVQLPCMILALWLDPLQRHLVPLTFWQAVAYSVPTWMLIRLLVYYGATRIWLFGKPQSHPRNGSPHRPIFLAHP